jgi:tripartite-type tricarboxylate transporter receptor subunit TctC
VVRAQAAYPGSSQIKVVVPYPAGGTTDIVGRVFAERIAARWGVTAYVENVPGAGASLGMDRVAKGSTDGTSILIVPPNLATNEFLYNKLPFDPANDIINLGQMVRFPNLVVVKKDLPINNIAELIAYAKANPNKLNCANSGVGTTIHLSAAMFCKITGVEMTHVPYRGSAPAITDLLGGQVDVMFDNIPSIISHARAGGVRPLAVTSLERSQTASDFPAVSETVKGYDATSWFGVGVKAGTPKEICDKIEKEMIEICKEEAVIAKFKSLHADTVGTGAAVFSQFVKDERTKWGGLIKDLKIKAE